MGVLRALGFVIHGQIAVAISYHCRGEQFHRIVMFTIHPVFGGNLVWRGCEGSVRIAARRRRHRLLRAGHWRHVAFVEIALKISLRTVGQIVYPHTARCISCRLVAVGNHKCHGLTVEKYAVIF